MHTLNLNVSFLCDVLYEFYIHKTKNLHAL